MPACSCYLDFDFQHKDINQISSQMYRDRDRDRDRALLPEVDTSLVCESNPGMQGEDRQDYHICVDV